MSEVAGSDVEIGGVSMNDTVIRSEFDAVRWAVATSLVVALVFVSALYPAWRASRLDPVESMRTYG
jgi:ABC-type lipoprotein release transport system permease subunit